MFIARNDTDIFAPLGATCGAPTERRPGYQLLL